MPEAESHRPHYKITFLTPWLTGGITLPRVTNSAVLSNPLQPGVAKTLGTPRLRLRPQPSLPSYEPRDETSPCGYPQGRGSGAGAAATGTHTYMLFSVGYPRRQVCDCPPAGRELTTCSLPRRAPPPGQPRCWLCWGRSRETDRTARAAVGAALIWHLEVRDPANTLQCRGQRPTDRKE